MHTWEWKSQIGNTRHVTQSTHLKWTWSFEIDPNCPIGEPCGIHLFDVNVSLFRMCNPWGLLSCLAGDINSPPAVWLGQWAEKYRTTIKEKRSMVPMVALQLYHEECVGDVRFKHTVTGFWCKKRMQQKKSVARFQACSYHKHGCVP